MILPIAAIIIILILVFTNQSVDGGTSQNENSSGDGVPSSFDETISTSINNVTEVYNEVVDTLSSLGGIVKLSPRIEALTIQSADSYSLSRDIIIAQVWQESRGKPDAHNQGSGAIGLMQILPSTAKDMGLADATQLYVPETNLNIGCKYMRYLLNMFGNYTLALAAYNGGLGNVRKAGNKIPAFPETQEYVKNILHNAGFGADQIYNV